ncbi:hypothetical protein RHMOL_Rhmol05G0113000 [Rhododendron molle]|uniref:Uncharacterized protein n=1 Tax=Rhododendron molle TaxID=49168 RepID=A0ACC0NMM5_RHOML|nr:hypothetical protein RHMOL_Rhmol05G0113000 [Rhododendron molle]
MSPFLSNPPKLDTTNHLPRLTSAAVRIWKLEEIRISNLSPSPITLCETLRSTTNRKASMKIQRCSRRRFKMQFETDDSRISRFMGTITSFQVATPLLASFALEAAPVVKVPPCHEGKRWESNGLSLRYSQGHMHNFSQIGVTIHLCVPSCVLIQILTVDGSVEPFRFLRVRTIVGRDSGFLIYKASSVFLDRYSDLLPTGGMHEWYLKKDLAVWLEGVYFWSFLHCSFEGMCFALLVCETCSHREYQRIDDKVVPVGYQQCVCCLSWLCSRLLPCLSQISVYGIPDKGCYSSVFSFANFDSTVDFSGLVGSCVFVLGEVNAETIAQLGDPKQAICDAVQKHNIDLLVLSDTKLGKIQRFISVILFRKKRLVGRLNREIETPFLNEKICAFTEIIVLGYGMNAISYLAGTCSVVNHAHVNGTCTFSNARYPLKPDTHVRVREGLRDQNRKMSNATLGCTEANRNRPKFTMPPSLDLREFQDNLSTHFRPLQRNFQFWVRDSFIWESLLQQIAVISDAYNSHKRRRKRMSYNSSWRRKLRRKRRRGRRRKRKLRGRRSCWRRREVQVLPIFNIPKTMLQVYGHSVYCVNAIENKIHEGFSSATGILTSCNDKNGIRMIWCHHIVPKFNVSFPCGCMQELFQGYYFCQEREDFFQQAKPYKDHLTILRLAGCKIERVYRNCSIIDADGADLGLYRKSHIPDGPGYQEIYFNPGDTGLRWVFHTKLQKLELQFAGISGFQRQFELWFSRVQKPQDTGLDSCDHWKRVMEGHAGANLGVGRLGAATMDMSHVALRIVEAYWEYCLQPWDMAAGVLIVEEAGGVVYCMDGEIFVYLIDLSWCLVCFCNDAMMPGVVDAAALAVNGQCLRWYVTCSNRLCSYVLRPDLCFSDKCLRTVITFEAERGYRNALCNNMRFKNFLFPRVSKLCSNQNIRLQKSCLWKQIGKNAKTAQATKRYYQGQASLYLPACQCCYLMSDLVGGYLNPSQLEIPFSSEIPDIQKQGVSVLMGYNGLQDLIESAQKESVMNLKDGMGDYEVSLACKQFPSILFGCSPPIELYDDGLLSSEICKEFLSSSVGMKWVNPDSPSESWTSLYPCLPDVNPSFLREESANYLPLSSERLNLEAEQTQMYNSLWRNLPLELGLRLTKRLRNLPLELGLRLTIDEQAASAELILDKSISFIPRLTKRQFGQASTWWVL